MSSSVSCPREKEIIPMENCCKCEHIRKEDDVSTVFCRFLIGKYAAPKKDIRTLYTQINYKQRRAERFYKIGKPKIAEQYEYEIMKLRKEIKEYEIKDKTFDKIEKNIV
jgi:hypothetical protein